jgi:DNA repair exonuclease SbcCD ATPase subunit
MKIKSLYLENFIGIKKGLGIKKLTLDFSKGKNKFFLLKGDNGTGKTTILSNLTPFHNNNDDDRKIVTIGGNGVKKLVMEDKGDIYELELIYSKGKNKGYITKNGKQLNENGNITSYEEVIMKEFGIDKSFSLISRLGSNVNSFIEKEKTERKKFINSFSNESEEYLVLFNKIKKIVTTLKERISYIKEQIKELNLEDIKEEKVEVTQEIKNLKIDIDLLKSEKNKLEAELNAYLEKNKEFKEEEIEENKKKYITIKNKIDESKEVIEKFLDDNEKLKEIYNITQDKNKFFKSARNTLSKKKEELNNIYIKNITELGSKKKRKTEMQEELREIKLKIDSCTEENLNQTIENYENDKKKIKKDKQIIEDKKYYELIFNYFNKGNYKKEEFIKLLINENIVQVIGWLDEILIQVINTSEHVENKELFYTLLIENKISNKSVYKKIESKKEELNILNNKLSKLKEYEGEVAILKKRPSKCKIDDCPFIMSALNLKEKIKNIPNIEAQIKTKKSEVAGLERSNEEIEYLVEDAREIIGLLKFGESMKYNEIIKRYSPRLNNFFQLGSIGKALKEKNSKDFYSFRREISSLKEIIEFVSVYINLRNKNKEIKEKILSKQKIIDLEIQLKKDFKSKSNEINKLEEEIKSLSVNKEEVLIKKINKREVILDKIEEHFNLIKENEINLKELDKFKIFYEELVKIRTKKKEREIELDDKIEDKEKILSRKESRMNYISGLESNKKKYEENLSLIKSDYEDTLLIKDALDPKLGIPLIFTKSISEKIEEKTNELLDIIYGGLYRVEFEISEKEYGIKGISFEKEFNQEDVREASQGERVFLRLSISLAIFDELARRYNILRTDELDGELDASKRSRFIDILDKQTDKLGIEQVFIISHNDAFDSIPAGLLLLPGSDKTVGKNQNLIFKA